MNISLNIQSIVISYLKIKELTKIQTVNKQFYNDLIKNKKTIANMIKHETFLYQKDFLYYTLSDVITNILLIKYNTIENIYNKYKNINNNNYISILDDILSLIINKSFNPYHNYTQNFVYIDMIYIKIMKTNYYINDKLISCINKYLTLSQNQEKIHKFILLTSKRIIYNYNSNYIFNNNTSLYEIKD